MQVIATAGHVDHGKSTLVRALTGMEPDRWAEERRRGMTIDLGYAWTTLPAGGPIAFVDVPGHERFVPNMLAGVGPVPAVCLVVAADEGWRQQTEEHLLALQALGVAAGVLVVTKADLADPGPALAAARDRLASTPLAGIEAVAVSVASGDGLAELTGALGRLVAGLPAADPHAPVRLWVDRSFTIAGAGTVVTGTLPAGTIELDGELLLVGGRAGQPSLRAVRVRGLQSHQQEVDRVTAIARTAVNLRGVARPEIGRGDALVTPGAWSVADTVDVRVADGPLDGKLPADVVAHVGSAAVPARTRPLDERTLRLQLTRPLPLHLGDRLLLRLPATRRVVGTVVVDLIPAPLRRRGDPGRHAASLQWPRSADDEVARVGAVRLEHLTAAGLGPPQHAQVLGEWAVAAALVDRWCQNLRGYAEDGEYAGPDALTRALGLPTRELLPPLLDRAGLRVAGGRLVDPASAGEPTVTLPPPVAALLAACSPDAPTVAAFAATGADAAALAEWSRAGVLLRLSRDVFVAPDLPAHALAVLARLPQPFSVSAARTALGCSRRTAIPLLAHLDATRRTRRDADDRRSVVRRAAAEA